MRADLLFEVRWKGLTAKQRPGDLKQRPISQKASVSVFLSTDWWWKPYLSLHYCVFFLVHLCRLFFWRGKTLRWMRRAEHSGESQSSAGARFSLKLQHATSVHRKPHFLQSPASTLLHHTRCQLLVWEWFWNLGLTTLNGQILIWSHQDSSFTGF